MLLQREVAAVVAFVVAAASVDGAAVVVGFVGHAEESLVVVQQHCRDYLARVGNAIVA